MSRIYTKSGDGGMTSLANGERVKKCDARIESYGTVDELSSFIGLLICRLKANGKLCEASSFIDFLLQVQNDLFSIGAALATPTCVDVELDEARLEREIDDLQMDLPELHAFILPDGCEEAALSHVCRTVCRRAERNIIKLQENSSISNKIVIYINRLSDYFFVLAKKCNYLQQIEENTWNNHCR